MKRNTASLDVFCKGWPSRSAFLIFAREMSLRLAFLIVACLFLIGCPTSDRHDPINYGKRPSGVHIDTLPDNHPFCQDPSPSFPSIQACVQARKFRLSWDEPSDTAGLIGYRLYLDSIPYGIVDSATAWNDIVKRSDLASVILRGKKGPVDSLIFAVSPEPKNQDTLDLSRPRILLLDTVGAADPKRNIYFNLYPIYDDDHIGGLPGFAITSIGDNASPIPIQPDILISAREFVLHWMRPIDPTTLFNASADTGIIREYRFEVGVFTNARAFLRAKTFNPTVEFSVAGKVVPFQKRDSVFTRDLSPKFIGFAYVLPDGDHLHLRPDPPNLDSLSVKVSNLLPQDTLRFNLIAVDSSGNRSSSTDFTVILTDTTQPQKPILILDSASLTRNRFAFHWLPSRDSITLDSTGKLGLAPNPDQGIREYRLKTELLNGGAASSRKDTVIGSKATKDSLYRDSLVHLAPGSQYRITLRAVDSSGHLSQIDTLLVSLRGIAFADSGLTLECPPGFIPLPGRRMVFGDTSANPVADEKAPRDPISLKFRNPYIASFCIEPYEHSDSSGHFQNAVTWEQADSACREISEQDSTRLCSEAQWERACKSDDSLPLVYGFQNDRTETALLQNECNQGTNDSLPAIQKSLRSNRCLTQEGVYDLPGQYSEWVLDAYDSSALGQWPGDTLPYSFALPAKGSPAIRTFRGGNYFKPSLPISQVQTLARCTNRDTPREVRPKFKPECIDTLPKILVTYGTDFNLHRCWPLPASTAGQIITDVYPLRDSLLLILTRNKNDADTFHVPQDSISKGRRVLDVKLTGIAIAAVKFVNPAKSDTLLDTLDAKEFRNTPSDQWEKILAREAGPGYAAAKVNGKPDIRLLYGFALSGSKPGRANYASRSLAFRCCAKPREVVKEMD